MRIFFSAGEPSGDIHGANLIRSLRALQPNIECVGFGGERMAAAGCHLHYPLCQLAVMWIVRVLAHVPTFLQLVSQADRYFRHQRPDALVLIDYPGFNWWLARRARFHGIPVFWFVPPQLWAWAGWRIRKVQRWVDHVLCTLPFEEEWYRSRGVSASYIGHPFFDELPRQQLDAGFLKEQASHPGPIVGLLPGSRTQEVERNLSTLLRTAARVHAARPDTRFLVAGFKAAHREYIQSRIGDRSLPIEVHVGRTPEIIQLAHSCVAVSGSVGLELLYRGKPTVVVYRARPLDLRFGRWLMTSRYISLVNLLADRELFPEFLTDRNEHAAISEHVLRWLSDPAAYASVCGELAALRQNVAEPGACGRAARFLVSFLGQRRSLDRRQAA